jgi:hypothetical protein
VSGYSGKIRNKYAPPHCTDALKKLQIREYGYEDARLSKPYGSRSDARWFTS